MNKHLDLIAHHLRSKLRRASSGLFAGRDRWVLCRPEGGLNDMLCQIEKCCRFADKTGRSTIVDTAYEHSSSFQDSFDNYFVPRQRRLRLSIDGLRDRIGGLSVYPGELQGRLFDYRHHWDSALSQHVESDSGIPLNFGFSPRRRESVLLHHDAGGGSASKYVFLRMRLHDEIADTLLQRLRQIGGNYTALHIRNTDYQTCYHEPIEKLAASVDGPVFVATDSLAALNDCRQAFGSGRVISFADLSFAVDNQPLHSGRGKEIDLRARNRDAIVDLFLLAIATRLHLFTLASKAGKQGRYSGFSVLARNLSSSATLINSAVGRDDRLLKRLLRNKHR